MFRRVLAPVPRNRRRNGRMSAKVSQYAENLPQLDTGLGKWGREIPSDPAMWSCDETGVKENLWLNLSTGFIGSGRQVSLTCLLSVTSDA